MKILLADDHDVVRDGLKLIWQRLSDDLEILEADNFGATREIATSVKELDMIMLDLFMPGMEGPRGVGEIRSCAPCVPILVLSMSEEPDHMNLSLKLGANGYIPKTSSNKIIANAIRLVLDGGIYIPPEMVSELRKAAVEPDIASKSELPVLTERQLQVLKLLAEGKTNKEIGRLLNITDTTVKSHTTTIYKQLGARNRTQAVHYALQLQLV